MASPGALAYLAWRASIAHPLKKLFRQRGTGLERFRAAYVSEGLAPISTADRELGAGAARCISCGLCELGCDLARATPEARALGLHAVFRLYTRHPAGLRHAREPLAACAGCAGCDALCPTGVPIARVLAHFRAVDGGARDAAARGDEAALVSSLR